MQETHLIWDEITTCLKDHLSGPAVQTFMSSARPLSFENNVLTIEVPNIFSKEWIKDKCEPIIRENLPSINYSILFEYKISTPKPYENEQLSIFEVKAPVAPINHQFNPKYAFDNFIVGHNNRFAYASAQAVVKSPAKSYNPLFIYGSVGLGKTHLLHAMCLSIGDLHPHLTTKLVSCEKFTNDLINSIKDKPSGFDAFILK